jgi:hypothetical protein
MPRAGVVIALLGALALAGCQPKSAPEPVGAAAAEARRAACEVSGGRLVALGAAGGLMFCQRLTADAGKACSTADQCVGVCLARSRSCAPATPLIGCNEVLTASGLAVTECVQ